MPALDDNTVLETETLRAEVSGIDALSPIAALKQLYDGQIAAVQSLRPAIPQIEAAAEHMTGCVRSGGNLAYVGAGSSGLMAIADGLELQGTFGISQDRIHLLFPGGTACLGGMQAEAEDDIGLARRDGATAGLRDGDCAILVSASGTTPYTTEVAKIARSNGAVCVGLANNFPSPLLDICDFPVYLPTPPEVIAGSTRMGAGTAQKIALNLLSTMMGIRLGHVYDGMMINLRADNHKLIDRANRIVMSIAHCSQNEATRFLKQAEGSIKIAVLLASGAGSVNHARQLLGTNRGNLRSALLELSVSPS